MRIAWLSKCASWLDMIRETRKDCPRHARLHARLKAVFGPDESDDELLPDASKATKIKIWLYQRKKGYLPIRDRRQMLVHHLAEHGITEQH